MASAFPAIPLDFSRSASAPPNGHGIPRTGLVSTGFCHRRDGGPRDGQRAPASRTGIPLPASVPPPLLPPSASAEGGDGAAASTGYGAAAEYEAHAATAAAIATVVKLLEGSQDAKDAKGREEDTEFQQEEAEVHGNQEAKEDLSGQFPDSKQAGPEISGAPAQAAGAASAASGGDADTQSVCVAVAPPAGKTSRLLLALSVPCCRPSRVPASPHVYPCLRIPLRRLSHDTHFMACVSPGDSSSGGSPTPTTQPVNRPGGRAH